MQDDGKASPGQPLPLRQALPRRLGRTELWMPPLGLGGAAIGNLHGAVAPEAAQGVLGGAWSGGVRYFDTAPLYGRGLGELRVGAALREHPRDSFILSSKVGWRTAPLQHDVATPSALPFALHCDYSREGTLRSVEDSLQRLGLERLDAVFVHDVDPYNHGQAYPTRLRDVLEGALPALHDLRRAGLVRAIGVAVNSVEVCQDVLREASVDAFLLAGRYTLLDRSAGEQLLPECARRGVGVILGAPFNSGALAGGAAGQARYNYRPLQADTAARLQRLRRACEGHGVSLIAAALQFPLTHPAVVAVLPGPRTPEQMRGVLAAADEPIPQALWDELAAAAREEGERHVH